jgi:hypothetical protein
MAGKIYKYVYYLGMYQSTAYTSLQEIILFVIIALLPWLKTTSKWLHLVINMKKDYMYSYFPWERLNLT